MNKPNAPWMKYYEGLPETLEYPNGSMYEAIRDYAISHNKLDWNAYEFQGKATTYSQFLNKIDTVGKAFKAIGIEKGDRVTVCMPNAPQGVNTFYALNRIGAIPAMIHPLSAVGEITFYVNNSDMAALDDDRENGHIRRVHTRNPRGLRQGLRTVLLELLTAFKTNRYALIVIEPFRNANRLIQFRPLRRLSLLFDVGRIMTHN